MLGDVGAMTNIAHGIQTPISRPRPDGHAGKRLSPTAATPLRTVGIGGGALTPDAAIARLRRFLESGERPACFVLPGSFLNILV